MGYGWFWVCVTLLYFVAGASFWVVGLHLLVCFASLGCGVLLIYFVAYVVVVFVSW